MVVFIGISLIGDAIIPSITLITTSSQCDMTIEYPPSILLVTSVPPDSLPLVIVFFSGSYVFSIIKYLEIGATSGQAASFVCKLFESHHDRASLSQVISHP